MRCCIAVVVSANGRSNGRTDCAGSAVGTLAGSNGGASNAASNDILQSTAVPSVLLRPRRARRDDDVPRLCSRLRHVGARLGSDHRQLLRIRAPGRLLRKRHRAELRNKVRNAHLRRSASKQDQHRGEDGGRRTRSRDECRRHGLHIIQRGRCSIRAAPRQQRHVLRELGVHIDVRRVPSRRFAAVLLCWERRRPLCGVRSKHENSNAESHLPDPNADRTLRRADLRTIRRAQLSDRRAQLPDRGADSSYTCADRCAIGKSILRADASYAVSDISDVQSKRANQGTDVSDVQSKRTNQGTDKPVRSEPDATDVGAELPFRRAHVPYISANNCDIDGTDCANVCAELPYAQSQYAERQRSADIGRLEHG